MSTQGVLIVTSEQDAHADFVVRELAGHDVNVVRFNAERAPDWQLTLEPGKSWSIKSDLHCLNSNDCVAVWWRRPESPPRPATTAPAEWKAVCAQWRAFCAGLTSVPGPRWVSSPFAIATAESKALQLSYATAAGFRVPRTIWTNTRTDAEWLLSQVRDEGVCKSVTSAYWETNEEPHFVFARRIESDGLPQADQLAPSPLSFQQMVAPKQDVRGTVVGAKVVAAIRQPQTPEEPIDWRLAASGTWHAHDLPPVVADACIKLVGDMSLRFAGIDLVLDGSGCYWFIELNPNGEWAWLQAAGLPIAELIAHELVRS